MFHNLPFYSVKNVKMTQSHFVTQFLFSHHFSHSRELTRLMFTAVYSHMFHYSLLHTRSWMMPMPCIKFTREKKNWLDIESISFSIVSIATKLNKVRLPPCQQYIPNHFSKQKTFSKSFWLYVILFNYFVFVKTFWFCILAKENTIFLASYSASKLLSRNTITRSFWWHEGLNTIYFHRLSKLTPTKHRHLSRRTWSRASKTNQILSDSAFNDIASPIARKRAKTLILMENKFRFQSSKTRQMAMMQIKVVYFWAKRDQTTSSMPEEGVSFHGEEQEQACDRVDGLMEFIVIGRCQFNI